MKNEWGFSEDDTFEERSKKVEKALEDPRYIESINCGIVIKVKIDGSHAYSPSEIESNESLLEEAAGEGLTLEPGDFKKTMAENLGQATNMFSKEGGITFEGEEVLNLVDSLLETALEGGSSPNLLGEMTEIVLAGALGIGFGLKFGEYQTDISIEGQGLLEDTYKMEISFRPTPKKIA